MFELILNILLVIFLVYTLFTHIIEAPIPDKVQRNPYALKPNIWPSVLIALLLICLAINIYKIIKKNKGNPEFTLGNFAKGIPAFFKGKLFLGILIIVISAYILEPLGFTVTSVFLLFTYGMLLGEKRWLRNLILSIIISLFLYLFFGVLLQVNLPRGTVPFLRDFALMLEGLFG